MLYIVMDTCHYTFVQDHRMYNSQSEASGEFRFGESMMCQCRFILGKIKCTILVSDADTGGGSACVGMGGM